MIKTVVQLKTQFLNLFKRDDILTMIRKELSVNQILATKTELVPLIVGGNSIDPENDQQ